jgi:hypothetical protein
MEAASEDLRDARVESDRAIDFTNHTIEPVKHGIETIGSYER